MEKLLNELSVSDQIKMFEAEELNRVLQARNEKLESRLQAAQELIRRLKDKIDKKE